MGMRIAQYYEGYGEGEELKKKGKFGFGVFEGIVKRVRLSDVETMKRNYDVIPDVFKVWLRTEYEDEDDADLFLDAVVGATRTAIRDSKGDWIIDEIISR